MKNVSEYQAGLLARIQDKGVEHIFEWFSQEIEGLAKAQVADMVEDMVQGNSEVPSELIAQMAEAWLTQNLMSEASSLSSQSSQVVKTALAHARVAELSNRIRRGNYCHKPATGLILTNTKLGELRTRLHEQARALSTPAASNN